MLYWPYTIDLSVSFAILFFCFDYSVLHQRRWKSEPRINATRTSRSAGAQAQVPLSSALVLQRLQSNETHDKVTRHDPTLDQHLITGTTTPTPKPNPPVRYNDKSTPTVRCKSVVVGYRQWCPSMAPATERRICKLTGGVSDFPYGTACKDPKTSVQPQTSSFGSRPQVDSTASTFHQMPSNSQRRSCK